MDRVGLVPVTLAAFGAGLYAIHPTDMAEHLYTYWDRYFAPKWQDQIEDLFSPPETFFFRFYYGAPEVQNHTGYFKLEE